MKDDLFEKFFGEVKEEDFQVKLPTEVDVLRPPTNIYETKEMWILELAVPGVTKDNVRISVINDILNVEGEKTHNLKEIICFHCLEWSFSKFRRRFILPDYAESQKINSHLENGILKIEIPKKRKKSIDLSIE